MGDIRVEEGEGCALGWPGGTIMIMVGKTDDALG